MFIDYLITPTDIKNFNPILNNVDEKLLYSAILLSQETDLRPILTDTYYEFLQSNQNLNSNDTFLIDNYIKPYLIYRSILRVIPHISSKVVNSGAMANTAYNSTNLNPSEFNLTYEFYKSMAQNFKTQMYNYLYENKSLYNQIDFMKQISNIQNVGGIWVKLKKKC